MERKTISSRPRYGDILDSQGLTYHDDPATVWSECESEPYWGEKAAI